MQAEHLNGPFMQKSKQPRHFLILLALSGVMAIIFIADTATHYEVAAAVFYILVILAAVRLLSRRAVQQITAFCIVLTLLSFALTPAGSYRIGLVNAAISIVAIMLTAYLVLKMEAARTAAHEAQAQLLRLARITSIGGLTASIAHEVNQPLAAIVTSGNACQRWLGQDPPNLGKARQALERMLADAGRASNIIARVRSLTQGQAPRRSVFDFNQAVLEIIALSEGEMLRQGITLHTDLDPALPGAKGDRVQVQQVMGNLVLNAMEAMATLPAHQRTISVSVQLQATGKIMFSITDSGVGLPEGVIEHLFDTFWTTKEDGMGIGLSISRTIIEANGGQLWAQPNAQAGATFRFSLPAAERQVQ